MKRKEKLFVLALLLLVGLTSGYIAKTYAKYASKVEGSSGAVVAKWSFKTQNENPEFTVNIASTVNEKSLVANKIAPGTNGSFKIKLLNDQTETGVKFTVTLKNLKVPKNLKFYTTDTYTPENEITLGAEGTAEATSQITGKIAAGESIDVPIYWAWAYGESEDVTDTTNVDDTSDGENADTFTIDFSIVGVQTDPRTEVTTGVDTLGA